MRAADLQLDFHAVSAGLERSIVGRVRLIAVAPRVNIFYSTKLFILLFAVAVLMLMLLSNQRRVS